MTPTEDVRGEPTTPEDEFWLEVGSRLDPEKSIERLDSHGRYLFSIVSVVSALLTGFGIFSPQLSSVFRNPLIFFPISLLALSLALAMIGITPQIKEKVNRFEIVSVQKFYRFQLLWRGWFIRLAGGAFALAILSAAVALTSVAHEPISPTLVLDLSGKGDQKALVAKVELEGFPQAVDGDIRVFGFAGPASTQPHLLFQEAIPVGAGGKLNSSIRVESVQIFSRFRMEVKISAGTQLLYSSWAEISRNS